MSGQGWVGWGTCHLCQARCDCPVGQPAAWLGPPVICSEGGERGECWLHRPGGREAWVLASPQSGWWPQEDSVPCWAACHRSNRNKQ